MLFQILQPQSAVFVDRLTAFNFKIGELIIPDEGVVQSVFTVVDSGRERIHRVSSLSCGVGHEVLLQALTVFLTDLLSSFDSITPQYLR